jgi:hypothetical protein
MLGELCLCPCVVVVAASMQRDPRPRVQQQRCHTRLRGSVSAHQLVSAGQQLRPDERTGLPLIRSARFVTAKGVRLLEDE